MITFIEHSSNQYPPRTFENASADITICFAFNFNTPGEILTEKAVKTQGKLYIPQGPFNALVTEERLMFIADCIFDLKAKSINIAGNGAYINIKYGFNQDAVDEFVYTFLWKLYAMSALKSVNLIRCGGQSGFDEAGLKAAVKLGIPALCVCPRGWKFKDVTGTTICNEQQFKNRFDKVLNPF